MKNLRFTAELADFFERRNRFAEADEYVGMAASGIPEVFVRYFDALPARDRRLVARHVAAAALGEVAALAPYLDEAAGLMLSLCLHGRAEYFAGERERLAGEFNDPANLRAWAAAGDDDECEGLDCKRQWRYAMKLWGVLHALRAEEAEPSYKYLLRKARSPHFKRTLRVTRELFDSDPFREP
ncbi:MAG TPA: hypothetical protein VIP46_10340 [Pyrinomonadaceae bacterium]